MSVTLLYGPGQAAKRNQLVSIKKKFDTDSISVIDFKQKAAKDLDELIMSRSMFSEDYRLIVAENIPKTFDLTKLAVVDSLTLLVLIADSAEKTSPLMQSAKSTNAEVLNFEGDKEVLVFPFLDNLIEGKKTALVELEKLWQDYNAFYILTMIYYLLRRNLLPADNSKSTFMKDKIKRQSASFGDDNWDKAYQKAIETEFKIKRGMIEEKIGVTLLVQAFLNRDF